VSPAFLLFRLLAIIGFPTFSNCNKNRKNSIACVPVGEKDWMNKKGSFVSHTASFGISVDKS